MTNFTLHLLARPFSPLVHRFFLGQVQGLEHVPKIGPYVLAANHVSVPDGWLIASLILWRDRRKVYSIARDDYWFNKRWSAFISKYLSVLLIDWRQPAAALNQALAVLASGGVVSVFPEGTRNLDSRALVLGKTGVARLALAARCPVIPIGYQGPPIGSLGAAARHFVFARHTATIAFGQPLDFSVHYHQPLRRELLYELTDKVMIEIGKLCGKRPRLHN